MGDQFRKVQPGDPLKIPAEAWNALVDLSRQQKNQRHDQLAEAEGTSRQTTLAKVRNQTGVDLDRFSIVALGTPIITPAANLRESKRQISFQGLVPSANTGPRFGVLLEPLKNNFIGTAAMGGCVITRVPIAQDACAACIQQSTPRAKNSVTCSKAIQYRTLVGMLPTPELLECIKPPTQGVGTELELLIEKTRRTLNWLCLGWLIPDKFNCGCHSTKLRMNEMGVRKCLRNNETLSAEILTRWIVHVPPIRFIPFVLTIIGFYVLRAAYNAESKEKLHG